MSNIPTGEGLSQTPLLERVRLARQELAKTAKMKAGWNPAKGGKLPDEVADQVLDRFGLVTLTDQEVLEIKINDITEHAQALLEHGKKMGWLPKDFKTE